MIFWIAAAVMASATVVAILWPLRRARSAMVGAEADLSVYRDQLREIERDAERGLISRDEAEAARIEVSRRILKTGEALEQSSARVGSGILSRVVPLMVAALLPIGALGLYLYIGRPDLPDQPREVRLRLPVDQLTVVEMIARVEARLKEQPEDVQGWDVLAPIYLRVGRYDDARFAFERAIQLDGPRTRRMMGLARSLTGQSNGVVTDASGEIYAAVLTRNPNELEAQFWLAVRADQLGHTAEALTRLEHLNDQSPPDAPWRAAVEERLGELRQIVAEAGNSAATAVPPEHSPSPQQVEEMSRLPPQERVAAIQGMVDSLAARLESQSDDLPGWQRLVRSYIVLGDMEKAQAALKRARTVFAAEPEARAQIDRLARDLGLTDG
ncbi:MAG: c-type cytochrome biogenesis protein CcmI [Hyphomicrobiaceae bacterium]